MIGIRHFWHTALQQRLRQRKESKLTDAIGRVNKETASACTSKDSSERLGVVLVRFADDTNERGTFNHFALRRRLTALKTFAIRLGRALRTMTVTHGNPPVSSNRPDDLLLLYLV